MLQIRLLLFSRKRRIPKVCFVILAIFLFRATLFIAVRDFLYLTRPIWDSPPKHMPKTVIPHYYTEDIDPSSLCRLHGWSPRKSSENVKVVDAVIFSVELDLREIRLRELWDVVDIFVVAEADKTFTGNTKPLLLQENQDRFSWAKEKLLQFKITDLAINPDDPFENEGRMRGHLTELVRKVPIINKGDLVIVADIDEIPYAHTIRLLKACTDYSSELHLEMHEYLYSFEFRLQTMAWRPHVTIYSPEDFRYHHGSQGSNFILADAGWHCSFCFRYISNFIFKMTSYSHSDRVTDQKQLDKGEIQRKICEGAQIFDMYPEAYTFRDLILQLGRVPKTSSAVGIPKHILQNAQKFKYLLPGGCIREDHEKSNSNAYIADVVKKFSER